MNSIHKLVLQIYKVFVCFKSINDQWLLVDWRYIFRSLMQVFEILEATHQVFIIAIFLHDCFVIQVFTYTFSHVFNLTFIIYINMNKALGLSKKLIPLPLLLWLRATVLPSTIFFKIKFFYLTISNFIMWLVCNEIDNHCKVSLYVRFIHDSIHFMS